MWLWRSETARVKKDSWAACGSPDDDEVEKGRSETVWEPDSYVKVVAVE
jgi:hypothetical protein